MLIFCLYIVIYGVKIDLVLRKIAIRSLSTQTVMKKNVILFVRLAIFTFSSILLSFSVYDFHWQVEDGFVFALALIYLIFFFTDGTQDPTRYLSTRP